MAAWQFTICLIPKVWASIEKYNVELLYDEDDRYDTTDAWVNNQPVSYIKEIISKYFEAASSWDKELFCWGNEEETDVNLWYENGIVFDISIRLDLRAPLTDTISKIVTLANELSCVVFIPGQKQIIEPNEHILMSFAKSSSASLFVNKPDDFFKAVSKKHNK